MDNNNDTDNNEDINNDLYVIAFKTVITCLPIHKYIINIAVATITYYCGNNNTITMSLDYITSKIVNIY